MSENTSNQKRLIEVSLPLKAISTQSAREKSIRHGHISTLHIWWARRPLAAMRAAIFASLVPAPETDEEREKLEDLIATIVDWDQVKHGNSAKVLEARQKVLDAFEGRPPRLLDPFMGGGATGLEALRLGCETHAVELNPVAHLIELCTLVYPQKYGQPENRTVQQGAMEVEMEVNPLAEDVRYWGQWVLAEAHKEIGQFYQDPGGGTVVAYLWARTARCPNPACGAEMPLVRQWWLAQRGKRKRVALKPIVDQALKEITFEVVHGDEIDFEPSEGTMRQGSVTCLFCRQTANAGYLQAEGKADRLGHIPLAVVLTKPGELGKAYRTITDSDRQDYAAAEAHLNGRVAEDPGLLPSEAIPKSQPRIIWVILYGIEYWHQLYNARQALAVTTFSCKVRQAYDHILTETDDSEYAQTITSYLALAVDRLADYLSASTRWRTTVEAMAGTFGRQALPMVWDYPELNPLGDVSGWSSSVEWIEQVIRHCTATGVSMGDVHQGTATRLSYPDNHFDAVITDPPYYDAVPYSELSDFFYVWLKSTLRDLYPDIFRTPLTPKGPEIVEQRPHRSLTTRKDKVFYETELTKAFQEAHRVLKPEGIFTVVFAHKSTAAWETLISSLLKAGLVVTASWPLHTERPGRMIAHDKAALASSIFLACRKHAKALDGYFDEVRQELTATIRERLDFFWQQGIRGADFFISAIGPAVSVFGRYSTVYRLDGSEVGVDALLDLVQEMVSEYALDRILNGGAARVGGVDAWTRYYILHRWAYGRNKIPFDDAMRLAMALGADVSALMERRGLLKQSGETVSLLGPKQRAGIQNLGLPDRTGQSAPVIDVLHRAATLWEHGERQALAEFLAEGARGREDQVRLVAQTLISILPDDDAERRLLEGFLAGREVLPEVATQERLF